MALPFLMLHAMICSDGFMGQSRKSQVSRPAFADATTEEHKMLVNPRVGPLSTNDLEAVSRRDTAKLPGECTGDRPQYTNVRKRAFRRARRRAEQHGGTLYRGRWRSARELGTSAGNPGMATGSLCFDSCCAK